MSWVPVPLKFYSACERRREHKAWGASPRNVGLVSIRACECGRQQSETVAVNGILSRPFYGLAINIPRLPGADAPGFMLLPASQAKTHLSRYR